ncbi:hypothetical protein QFC20_000049 [Naganishia adeliensis]|uniref:Uncharacterized protein n=1 Tax=Naganishia adeliensis TaxID=92952 RepID=A0ACC2X292_9TREE|nr:hypothetical protein QFC20_000049 [Naganishia adeliensis]
MSVDTSEPKYHKDFNDPQANVVVESADEVSFRVHDFYLKTSSPVFRDILGMSANLQDKYLPLPEPSQDLVRLLKVLTGNMDFTFDFQNCRSLYKLCQKYDIVGGCREWVSSAVGRCAPLDPFECFAFACENEPVDTVIATQSIQSIQPLPTSDEMTHISIFYRVSLRTFTSSYMNADPTYFSSDYIARLGIRNFSCYVSAWGVRSPVNLSIAKNPATSSAKEELEKLALTFCAGLKRWKA